MSEPPRPPKAGDDAKDKEETKEPRPKSPGESDPLFNPSGLKRRTTAIGLAPAPHLGGLSGSPGAIARAEEEARKQRVAARLAAARGKLAKPSEHPREEIVESLTGPPPPYVTPQAFTGPPPPAAPPTEKGPSPQFKPVLDSRKHPRFTGPPPPPDDYVSSRLTGPPPPSAPVQNAGTTTAKNPRFFTGPPAAGTGVRSTPPTASSLLSPPTPQIPLTLPVKTPVTPDVESSIPALPPSGEWDAVTTADPDPTRPGSKPNFESAPTMLVEEVTTGRGFSNTPSRPPGAGPQRKSAPPPLTVTVDETRTAASSSNRPRPPKNQPDSQGTLIIQPRFDSRRNSAPPQQQQQRHTGPPPPPPPSDPSGPTTQRMLPAAKSTGPSNAPNTSVPPNAPNPNPNPNPNPTPNATTRTSSPDVSNAVPTAALAVRPWEPVNALQPIQLAPLDPRLVLLAEPNSHRAAGFRALRDNLISKNLPRVTAVSSAMVRDGKTTCAANLALALSEQPGTKVLLFDGNFFEPELGRLFNMDKPGPAVQEPWLAPHQIAAVTDSLHVAAIVRKEGMPGWRFDQQRFDALLDRLCRISYDYIIIDTPALEDTPSARGLVAAADAAVLTVRSGRTTTGSLRRAAEQIPPKKALGVVLIDA